MFKYHSDMGHCFSYVVVVLKKIKKIKIKTYFFIFYFSQLGKTDMVLGKKVAIFDWELGRNLAPREGQKMP